MKSLQEYNEGTSAYELFTFLYWKIIDRELRNFSDLVSYTDKIPASTVKGFALRNCFMLIKKLYWGFFRDLSPTDYKRLWDRLTIPNRTTGFGADLKRNMTISNVYAAFVDIHGYTAFCQKAGRNTSLLRLLDESIERDIRELCKKEGVISNRMRGDEIILIAATALDIIRSSIGISEYFASRRRISLPGFTSGRTGRTVVLPELKVSIGISGGRKYTPLIITESGDLSGTVVNTAARLQSMANRLSRESTRILVSQYVHIRFLDEAKKAGDALVTEAALEFLKIGTIAMKGVRIPIVEVLADPEEKYRCRYQTSLKKLQESLRNGHWPYQIFLDLTELLSMMVRHMPSCPAVKNAAGGTPVDNKTFVTMLASIANAFRTERDFEFAVQRLKSLTALLETRRNADAIIIKYAKAILEKYEVILGEYRRQLNEYTESRESRILSLQEVTALHQLKAQSDLLQELHLRINARVDSEKRSILWQQGVQTVKNELEVKLYFGK